MPGRTARARSRRWPRSSGTPPCPSGRCGPAWTGWTRRGSARPCDPEIVAARIKRAGRRPKGWDLDLSLIRDDLTEADLAALEHQFPGLAARVAVAACPDAGGAADGLQSPDPAETVDNWPDGVQPLHPASGTGRNERTAGVQQLHPNRP